MHKTLFILLVCFSLVWGFSIPAGSPIQRAPIQYKSLSGMKKGLDKVPSMTDHFKEKMLYHFGWLEYQKSTIGEYEKEFNKFQKEYYAKLPPSYRIFINSYNEDSRSGLNLFDML